MSVSTAQSTKTRSPNYPAIDLAEAIQRIKAIYETQKQYPATRKVLAQLLGYSGINGASATLISAVGKYGLLEGHGDNLKVSDLGRDLVIHRKGDPEYARALRSAAFMPAFFRELNDQYPHGLPSEHSIRASLIKRGFNDKVIGNAVRAYRDTMEFVDAEAGEDLSDSQLNSSPERPMQPQTYKPETGWFDPTSDPNLKSVQLPLSINEWATIQAAFPLSEAAWNQMLAVLEVMKPALMVRPEPTQAQPTSTFTNAPPTNQELSLADQKSDQVA